MIFRLYSFLCFWDGYLYQYIMLRVYLQCLNIWKNDLVNNVSVYFYPYYLLSFMYSQNYRYLNLFIIMNYVQCQFNVSCFRVFCLIITWALYYVVKEEWNGKGGFDARTTIALIDFFVILSAMKAVVALLLVLPLIFPLPFFPPLPLVRL